MALSLRHMGKLHSFDLYHLRCVYILWRKVSENRFIILIPYFHFLGLRSMEASKYHLISFGILYLLNLNVSVAYFVDDIKLFMFILEL